MNKKQNFLVQSPSDGSMTDTVPESELIVNPPTCRAGASTFRTAGGLMLTMAAQSKGMFRLGPTTTKEQYIQYLDNDQEDERVLR